MSAAVQDHRAPDQYMKLIGDFPPRPIRSKADYRRATQILDSFGMRPEESLSTAEQDYIEILMMITEEYARTHQFTAAPDASPLDVLKHLMEENDMNTSDLGRLLGSKGVASEILNGKRALSKAHMGALAKRFHVNVSVFFPSEAKR